jgi:LPXTG-motif cell wall-anchored protein
LKKITSVVGISLFGLGSSLVAMPANAASLADCGTAPSGGTLTFSNNTCTLKFDNAGSYTFITPSVLSGLSAVISGAGGGAYVENASGYAGNGGEVIYKDMANTPAEDMILIVVGEGGTSSDTAMTAGAQTGITYNGGLTNIVADGGAVGSISNGYCALSGNYSTYLGFGIGASLNASSGANDTCVYSRGINPSLGHADSDGMARSVPLFDSYNFEFGKGGVVVASPAQLPSLKSGAGASIKMDLPGMSSVGKDDNGGDGAVVFRWSVGSSSLANTGSQSSNLLTVAGGAVAAGTILMAARRRSQGRHRA